MFLKSFLLILFAFFLVSSEGHAEGYHNSDPGNSGGGVDRFVYTNPDYIAASANASLTYSIPSAKWNDNPAFYLGGTQAGSMVDAGVNYDFTTTYQDPDHTPIPAGYAAFISFDNVFAAPRIWDKAAGVWRIWRRSSNKYSLTFEIDKASGKVSLTVAGLGTFYWAADYDATHNVYVPRPIPTTNPTNEAIWPSSDDATPVFTNTPVTTAAVKWVVAMNRTPGVHSESIYDDGATMSAEVSACQAKAQNSTNFGNWVPSIVDQSHTGYDSPANNAPAAKDLLAATGAPQDKSNWRVNFPKTDCNTGHTSQNEVVARTVNLASQSGTYLGTSTSRYQQEKVEIWLRHGDSPTVDVVQHPKQQKKK